MCVGQKFDINVAYVASYVYLGKYIPISKLFDFYII